jgi:glycosyltransferase involved in cell wall biosynthesis
LSGAEIGLLRFVQATHGVVSSHVVLAEDGDLVGALRDAGARVDVLALEEGARSLRRSELALGRRQLAAGGALGRYILALRALLRDVRPDLVHTVSLKAGVYGSTAARLGGVPVVWHLHDHLTAGYLPARAIAPMRALAGWWPSGLLVPSRSVLATVGRRRSGLLTDVLPFPVPLPEAAVEPREEVAVVGMLGRITPWKGQDVFLEAFAQAFPAGDVHARIIGNALFGETDYEQELHAQAARLGIADRVEFTGFRTDVDAELRRLDVLVHASVLPDPLPGVVLEGMGMGLPVVAADAGGNPEHVVDGVNGLLHVPGDVADLARALRRAAGPITDRAALGRAARESAHRYAPETVVEQILEFYAAVLRAAGRRPQPS